MTEQLQKAVDTYRARRDRVTHPAGKFDNAGRFWPSAGEQCECCTQIRTPSRAYPYSYMVHCRTAGHVAALHGVCPKQLRKAARDDV